MSWVESLHVLRLPVDLTMIGDIYWRSGSWYLYKYSGTWVISAKIGYSYLKAGAWSNESYVNTYRQFNDHSVYQNGVNYLWYNVEIGLWVVSDGIGRGCKEVWDNGYSGDVWWSCDAALTLDPETPTTFNERGHNRGAVEGEFNGDSFELEFYFKRYVRDINSAWPSDAPAGVYKWCDNEEITKKAGLLVGEEYYGSDIIYYTQSLEKVDGHYVFGDLHYDSDVGKLVLGTVGSNRGWWEAEGSEPVYGESKTLTFEKNPDSDATGLIRTINFNKYRLGNYTEKRYMSEVPVWL
jgi:hypothetical protein